jgi:hypothetical protein
VTGRGTRVFTAFYRQWFPLEPIPESCLEMANNHVSKMGGHSGQRQVTVMSATISHAVKETDRETGTLKGRFGEKYHHTQDQRRCDAKAGWNFVDWHYHRDVVALMPYRVLNTLSIISGLTSGNCM